MKRSLYRLVQWVDAAALNAGVDPQHDAARVYQILNNRRLAPATWWARHTGQNMVRTPSVKAQRALRRVYRERAQERASWLA